MDILKEGGSSKTTEPLLEIWLGYSDGPGYALVMVHM